jgi:hypothetical protein
VSASKEVSVRSVLEVMGEFEPLEPTGVSTGLIAWELLEPEHVVAAVMHEARERGMIQRAGWDPERGERLWRLTAQGRARLKAR